MLRLDEHVKAAGELGCEIIVEAVYARGGTGNRRHRVGVAALAVNYVS
jgi:hypothetical protein